MFLVADTEKVLTLLLSVFWCLVECLYRGHTKTCGKDAALLRVSFGLPKCCQNLNLLVCVDNNPQRIQGPSKFVFITSWLRFHY